jgi:hypothetical protein
MGNFEMTKYDNPYALAVQAFFNNEMPTEEQIIRRIGIIEEIVQMDKEPSNRQDREIAAQHGVSSDRVRALTRALYWAGWKPS